MFDWCELARVVISSNAKLLSTRACPLSENTPMPRPPRSLGVASQLASGVFVPTTIAETSMNKLAPSARVCDLCQGFWTVSRGDFFGLSGRGCGAAVVGEGLRGGAVAD